MQDLAPNTWAVCNSAPRFSKPCKTCPRPCVTSAEEVLGFIGVNALHGLGIGYVDARLLASAPLTQGGVLWTLDKRLACRIEGKNSNPILIKEILHQSTLWANVAHFP